MLSTLKTAARALYNLYPIATKPGEFLKESMPEALRAYETKGEPNLERIGWQLVTSSQMDELAYASWCALIRDPRVRHRKVWEWVYILEVLEQHGMLAEGKRGLGFGCGAEPLSALMANMGCEILATDV